MSLPTITDVRVVHPLIQRKKRKRKYSEPLLFNLPSGPNPRVVHRHRTGKLGPSGLGPHIDAEVQKLLYKMSNEEYGSPYHGQLVARTRAITRAGILNTLKDRKGNLLPNSDKTIRRKMMHREQMDRLGLALVGWGVEGNKSRSGSLPWTAGSSRNYVRRRDGTIMPWPGDYDRRKEEAKKFYRSRRISREGRLNRMREERREAMAKYSEPLLYDWEDRLDRMYPDKKSLTDRDRIKEITQSFLEGSREERNTRVGLAKRARYHRSSPTSGQVKKLEKRKRARMMGRKIY